MSTYHHNRFSSAPVSVEEWTSDRCMVHTANGNLHICNYGVFAGLVREGLPVVVTYQVGFKTSRDSRSTSFMYPRTVDIGAAVDSVRESLKTMRLSAIIVSVTEEF